MGNKNKDSRDHQQSRRIVVQSARVGAPVHASSSDQWCICSVCCDGLLTATVAPAAAAAAGAAAAGGGGGGGAAAAAAVDGGGGLSAVQHLDQSLCKGHCAAFT